MDHTRASVLSVCTAAIKSRIAFSQTQRNHGIRLRHSPVASALVIASCTCLISAVAHGEQRDKKRQASDPAEWLAKGVAPLSTERIAELLEANWKQSEIARELGISASAVCQHVKQIKEEKADNDVAWSES